MPELEKQVLAEVEKIVDFETGMTFGQMKMIQSLKETEPGVVKIDFIPTSPFCPMAIKLATEIKRVAENVEGVKKALVYCHGHVMEEKINTMINK
jgi:metal-sulfur cluster biosynthetic enzyme